MAIGDQEAFDRFWQETERAPRPARRRLAVPELVATAAGLLTVAGMVLLWPTGEDRPDLSEAGLPSDFFTATVMAMERAGCAFEPSIECDSITFELVEGPDAGTTFTQELAVTESSPSFRIGEQVVLSYVPEAEEGFQYQFADRQRMPVLMILVGVFAAAVLALGARRGAGALAGLGASLLVLVVFVLPALIDGRSPMAVAITGASAIAFLALYLAHGFTRPTTLALLGTIATLALTALLGALVVEAARFSGLVTEESFFLTLLSGEVDFRGLVLAGLVLGALGALDDVTVTQVSAVMELRTANPGLDPDKLFSGGMRIGRDHVASTVNTLFLAYAGASLPLLLLFVLASQPLSAVANGEVVAVEIGRALVGSIGLVAAVPITTWLAARFGRAPSGQGTGAADAGG